MKFDLFHPFTEESCFGFGLALIIDTDAFLILIGPFGFQLYWG